MTLKMRAVEPTLPPPIYSPELAIPEECKHPHFWFHDGDVVFSAESIHFKIHSHKVFPLSAIMFQVFEQSPKPVHPRGFYSLTELKGGYLGWSCLLGVIYNKDKATVNPTFQELLLMTRVTVCYEFSRIRSWVLARMRCDFFKNPQFMQDDTGEDEGVSDKLNWAMEVLQAWWFPREEFHNRALAIYAFARLDLESERMKPLAKHFPSHTWKILVNARRAMLLRYDEIAAIAADICYKPRVLDSHCRRTCPRRILNWMRRARARDSDVLRTLQCLPEDIPSPICQACIDEVRTYLEQAYTETSCKLPIYTGCDNKKAEDWDIDPALINTTFLLSPV